MQIHTLSYHPRPHSPQHDDAQRKWQDQYWKARRRRMKIVTLSLQPSVRSKGVFIWHFTKVRLFLTIKAQLVVSIDELGKGAKKIDNGIFYQSLDPSIDPLERKNEKRKMIYIFQWRELCTI